MKKIIILLISFGSVMSAYANTGPEAPSLEDGSYYCAVSKACASGGEVSCSGSKECSRGTTSVTCDGKTTACAK